MKRLGALIVPLLAVLILAHGARPSGADFVAASAHASTNFATASAFNSVAVTLSDPGSPLRGTSTVAAVATSQEPMANVKLQRSPAGAGTWTDVCTDTLAPFNCAWDTTGVGDGLYDLRAVATDTAGYAQTSATVANRRVDNTGPTVSVTDPGIVSGSKALTATAADAGSGVANVTLQYRTASSGTWTTICSSASSPYTCSWATAALADGLYDLRATSADNAGNSTTSATVANVRVDNTAPSVSVIEDGTPRHGNATLGATVDDGNGSGVASVKMEIQISGTWTQICVDTVASYSCTGNTALVPDGIYPLRATATDYAGLATVSAAVNTRIDNTAPSSATITDPGTPLSGTKALTGSAADAGSGIASLRFEYRPNGSTGAWSTACTDSVTPFTTCNWDTTAVTDGSYELRTVATDFSTLTTASASVAARIVDNNGPAVAVTDPGTPLRGTVTVGATASDVSGVTSVVIQRSPAGANTWTTICTDNTSSYSCSWNTAGVSDGSYDLRARATDSTGKTTTSALVTGRAVDNVTSPVATDIQGNNGGTSGRLDANDTIVFSYSQTILKTSIASAWTGTTLNLQVRVVDNGTSDYLDFYDSTNTNRINLTGSPTGLNTKANHVAAAGARFAATATQSAGVITVKLVGAPVAGAVNTGVTTATTMIWMPSTSATNASGKAVLGLSVNESGTASGDF